ncbi:hypothetical protein GDO81_010693 [Engystomops pustulosus]|uniref:Uncharacterized protein n=1 Tax=Engystomops pustulosus TaxID=76066 RepID=A0AAV7C271_ENGPU|nr:hypothetical protein GDO81_010693 [Engystomops pustulosus]
MSKMFKRKTQTSSNVSADVIPGWEQAPYSILAKEWAKTTGLSENWKEQLTNCSPVDVVQCLEKVPVIKGNEYVAVCRRGWILLTAYRQQNEEKMLLQDRVTELEQQLLTLQSQETMHRCQQQMLADKVVHYKNVAEKASVRVAQYKYKKRRGKINKQRVALAVSCAGVDWDPSKIDASVFSSTDEEESSDSKGNDDWEDPPDPVIDPPQLNAKPIIRREQTTRPGHAPATKLIFNDYTTQEVGDILTRYSQKPGEKLITWFVRIVNEGISTIRVDNVDVMKFVSISHEPAIQSIMREFGRQNQEATLLQVLCRGAMDKYPTAADWPENTNMWHSLKECAQRVMEEAMKLSVPTQTADEYLTEVFTTSLRNKILKSAPPTYKAVMMTLLINQVGHPCDEVVQAIRELGDFGDWGKENTVTPKREVSDDKKRDKGNNEQSKDGRLSRIEMFRALLKAGVPVKDIDGVPTSELWKIYRDKIGKNVSKASTRGSRKGQNNDANIPASAEFTDLFKEVKALLSDYKTKEREGAFRGNSSHEQYN